MAEKGEGGGVPGLQLSTLCRQQIAILKPVLAAHKPLVADIAPAR